MLWPLGTCVRTKTLRSAHPSLADHIPVTESSEPDFLRGDIKNILRLSEKWWGEATHRLLSPQVNTQPARGVRSHPTQSCFSSSARRSQQVGTAKENWPRSLTARRCENSSSMFTATAVHLPMIFHDSSVPESPGRSVRPPICQ